MKGVGDGTYFPRRRAERCRREIKARNRATLNPTNAAMSGLRVGRRRRPQGTGTGTGTGARAADARAALRLGPAPRGSAPGSPLAPGTDSGSHMTPAPLALRASRGWRDRKNEDSKEAGIDDGGIFNSSYFMDVLKC